MWARRAHATLALAAQLKESKVPTERHWRVAFGLEDVPDGPGYPCPPTSVEEGRRELTCCVNYWLNAAEVRPFLEHRSSQPTVSLGSGWGNSPLFGSLAIQLAFVTSGAGGYAVCDECHVVYAPSRTPRVGESHFCADCRATRKAPQRKAAASYRARIKEAKRLHAKGWSIAKVAAKLKKSESKIRSWIDRGRLTAKQS